MLLGAYAAFGVAAFLGLFISFAACVAGAPLKTVTASLFTSAAVYYFPIAYSGERWYSVCLVTALVWIALFARKKPKEREEGVGDGAPRAETAGGNTERR